MARRHPRDNIETSVAPPKIKKGREDRFLDHQPAQQIRQTNESSDGWYIFQVA